MSRGRKLKMNSSPLVFGGGSSSAAADSGWVKVATETRSPKFDFINSVIFDFSSSGEGNGGGGFCSILANRKGRAKIDYGNGSSKFDSRICNSFISSQLQISPQLRASPAKSTGVLQYRSRTDKAAFLCSNEIAEGTERAAKSARDIGI